MPTSPDYLEIHNHVILRSIQETIKMRALFYGIGYCAAFPLVADSMRAGSTPVSWGKGTWPWGVDGK